MEPPEPPDELVIELLTKQHKTGAFSCGEKKLDDFLKLHAKKNTSYGYGRTYVAVKPGHPRVWAFCTLAASYVEAEHFPSAQGSPQRISVILLGRIGVERALKGKRIGQLLMAHTFKMSVEAADRVGVHAVVLDAKTPELTNYYQRFGFTSLMDDPLHMYLPIELLRQAMQE